MTIIDCPFSLRTLKWSLLDERMDPINLARPGREMNLTAPVPALKVQMIQVFLFQAAPLLHLITPLLNERIQFFGSASF